MVARNSSASTSSSLLVASASPRSQQQQLQHNAAAAASAAARAAARKVVPFCRFSSSSYYGRSHSQRSIGTEASIGSTETANNNNNNNNNNAFYCPKQRDVAAIQPRRRRVRFDFDENTDAVRSTVHVYPKVSGESEKALCWNSKHDIQRMKRELHQEAVDFVKLNPGYIGCLEKLFHSPLSRHPPSIDASQSNSNSSSSTSTSSSSSEFDAALFVTRVMAHESAPRGLEYRMSFLIHRHKQWTRSTVLQRQAQLHKEAAILSDRSSSSASASAAHHRHWQVSEALARCCQHLSRCTGELAVQYARADALQAQQVYGDAFLSLCPM
jgi:hypothetical protein